MAQPQRLREREERLSIGQVLDRLQLDFTDLSLSKLRFLEERGLVTPERTSSGYRKFSQQHIERIRLVLTLQRDHYLPLKVIAEYLDDLDEGKNPDLPGVSPGQVSILQPKAVLRREELLRATGASSKLLNEAIVAGLIPAMEVFPQETIGQLQALMELERRGITPRHLRPFRVSVERDAELLKRAAAARSRRSSGGEGDETRREDALEMADFIETLRKGILRHRLMG